MTISIAKAIELAKGKVSRVENWASDEGGQGAWLIRYGDQSYLFNKSDITLLKAMEILRRTIAGQALAEMGYTEAEILNIASDPLLAEDGDIQSLVNRGLKLLKGQ